MSISQTERAKQKIKNVMFVIASTAVVFATSAVAYLTTPHVLENLSELVKLTSSSVAEKGATTVTIADDGAIVCDSIVQGARDCDLPDGNYIFRITGNDNETIDYPVELINYYDDVTYSLNEGETASTVSLGDDTTEYKTLIVKYHKNLTVEKGVKVTATAVEELTYKKGMYLCVLGELVNNGEISMTARGTYNQAGENVYLWKNIDGSYEYVPAVGGTGAKGVVYVRGGIGETSQIKRGTGGGGSGASLRSRTTSGSGSAGTSYSGGSGGGGASSAADSGVTAYNAEPNGGAGGMAVGRRTTGTMYVASGGAGNLGGKDAHPTAGKNVTVRGNAPSSAENGTGGLLIIYSLELQNNGTISANGSSSNPPKGYDNGAAASGGSSGGGSVNIFSGSSEVGIKAIANGGISNACTFLGGNGGDGSVTYTQLKPDLNYPEKQITLQKGSKYSIDNNKLKYVNQPSGVPPLTIVGDIQYEIMNSDIATIDHNGNIIANKSGRTRIKIKDITNNVSTYVFLTVVDGTKVTVQEGNNFTIALKQNGTIWSYGTNVNGELGNGTNENALEPVQVVGKEGRGYLEEIKQITSGYSHTLALGKNGEIYSWGLGTNGQLGNGENQNSNVPVLVQGLSNIEKVDAYQNLSIALAKDGKVYAWGEGYSAIPMRVILSEKVVDISGTLLLTEKGQVYDIKNISAPIEGLKNIVKISCGDSHYLALSNMGITYSWGTNNYGECGISETGLVGITEIIGDIIDISAGKNTTMLLSNTGKVYVCGDNANGQLGLAETTNVDKLTTVILSENVQIEEISVGEGTHTGLVDINGFVWHSGTNSEGQLGLGTQENTNIYVKNGKAIIKSNFEQKYLDIGDKTTVVATLENSFNLKKDLVNNEQTNFSLDIGEITGLNVHELDVTAINYGSYNVKIVHNETQITKEINITIALIMDSIVQGFKDLDLPDGNYSVVVQNEPYNIELINYYDDVTYSLNEGETSTTVSLGDNTTQYKTVVAKYHKNLTIDQGVKVTATSVDNLTYKKGMYVCVLGNLVNNGEISMTARGTYNCEGQDVYLWKNIDNTYEFIPAVGSEGGIGIPMSGNGIKGADSTNRGTGGGGSGGSWGSDAAKGGNGGSGTAFSGGAGGGGTYHAGRMGSYPGSDGSSIGAEGGTGGVRSNTANSRSYTSGGAGNLAGAGAYASEKAENRFGNAPTYAENGTGGLLILYADNLINQGAITSNGSNVNGQKYARASRYSGGGASGGGSINIFAKTIPSIGEVASKGGLSTVNGAGLSYAVAGGNGGDGNVTINELGSELNYAEKTITLQERQNYQIDINKITYTKLNDIQTKDLELGTLIYESLDTNIATVNSNGRIIAVHEGTTKIKITDQTNGYTTYVIVEVTKTGIVSQIKEGQDFTIALKQNGTVWGYGRNGNGQLGNHSQSNSNEPIIVVKENGGTLSNIIGIGAGTASSIAVDKEGKVYTWGLIMQKDGESGANTQENKLTATQVQGLENIVFVEAYQNNFYAIDNNGNGYVWGEGYEKPTKIENSGIPIKQIAGTLILAENGLVFKIDNPTESLPYLSNIAQIASDGTNYGFVTIDGFVYTMGPNEKGQRGIGHYNELETPSLVKTQEGNLESVYQVSIQNQTAMAVTMNGEVYVWGDNTNKQIGIIEEKTCVATKITNVQNQQGEVVSLSVIENIVAGVNKTSFMDKDGFVYSVGDNTYGQLGTSDNENREIYTKIEQINIITEPEEITISIGQTKDIKILLSNKFNLKTDIAENGKVIATTTNNKKLKLEPIEIDNSEVVKIEEFKYNYRITGNKIGRVCVTATTPSGIQKNIWVNVVNASENNEDLVSAKVQNGKGYTIVLKSDGTVWSFGENENGQLGLGSIQNTNQPKKIDVPEKIIDIVTGESHTLLLGKSGQVYSFGLNHKGQLGLGNLISYKMPIKIELLNHIVKIEADSNTSFAIDQDGKVYSWGEGYTKEPKELKLVKVIEKQVTNENGENVTITEEILENVIAITKNYYLTAEGKVKQYQLNSDGNIQTVLIQLSLYDQNLDEKPTIIEEEIIQISEGIDHLLMLGKSGRVYSYGQNVYGQLGDTTIIEKTQDISSVVRVKDGSILENIVEVSAGDKYSVVTSQDGKVYTFGWNKTKNLGFNNELSEGGIQEYHYAVLKEDVTNVERTSAGYLHTSCYLENGDVYTWGQGTQGELGNDSYNNHYLAQLVGKNIIQTNTNSLVLEETEKFNLGAWIHYFNLFTTKQTEISYEVLDTNLAMINSKTGEVMALKEGRTTVLAKEIGTEKIAVVDLRILAKSTKPQNMDITIEPQVGTSGNATVMLKVDGTVWSYGIGNYGELGTGKIENKDEPQQVVFPEGTIITQIAVGENHILALDSQGNVWSWGRNQYYQLGNATDSYLAVPTKVQELTNIKKIACGNYSSFAISQDGELYSFGLNANGEGGIGSYTNKTLVTKAKYMTDVIDVKAGKNHTILLKSTGEVFATGSNLYGELGQGETSVRKTNTFLPIKDLPTIVKLGVSEGSNLVLAVDGSTYGWGSNIYQELGAQGAGISVKIPTKILNLNNIRMIEGGKGYFTLLNSQNEVYEIGQNSSGELGNGTNENLTAYTKLNTISDVISISAGNGYTVFLKQDGTVWAAGDYTHGREEIKSKTKTNIPIQVGNSSTGFEETQILLKVGEDTDLGVQLSYQFNLIQLEENFFDSITCTSMNNHIASVDENGIVTGLKVGTTRIQATGKAEDTKFSILVKVLEDEAIVAPKVVAGENFATVLKQDGSIWSFGYNVDGRLGIGNNVTKDIPNKTNILLTYENAAAGKDFIVALRSDGSVWTVGNNSYGQQGSGNTKNRNKLTQIANLNNITQITAGEDFGLALDAYGVVYGWGNNNAGQLGTEKQGKIVLEPIEIRKEQEKIIHIAAGKEQSIFVTESGKVYGNGKMLNGEMNGVTNIAKAEVGDGCIILLTNDGSAYQYQEEKLTKVAIDNVVDICAKAGSQMYQTAEQKIYVAGNNIYGQLGIGTKQVIQELTQIDYDGQDTFGIAVGYRNTYLIDTLGNVYAAGSNVYGAIGNGTRKNMDVYTLVGDREFTIEPESKMMQVGDVEQLIIKGNPFNVFNRREVSVEGYDFVTDNIDSITLADAKITAIKEGTVNIVITDKLTGQNVVIKRIVVDASQDRIDRITVDDNEASLSGDSTQENMKYTVKVVTKENNANLRIKTKNLTDRISIDGGNTWSYNGELNQPMELAQKLTNLPILVGVQNNEGEYVTQLNYVLEIEKISNDNQLKEITLGVIEEDGTETTKPAIPVGLTRYEVAIKENQNLSFVKAITNNSYAKVSIDGQEYNLNEQMISISMENHLTKEMKIIVQSEVGQDIEYTLVIYQEKAITNLESVTVNTNEAIKVSEGVYAVRLEKDTKEASVIATASNSFAQISIENNEYAIHQNMYSMVIESDTTIVNIIVKSDNGDIKKYQLYIYLQEETVDLDLNLLLVNGQVIEKEINEDSYIAYLPNAETQATIRAISKNGNNNIEIQGVQAMGDCETFIELTGNETTCQVVVSDGENSKTYTVVIKNAQADVSLDKILVSSFGEDIEAKLISDNTYLAKIPRNWENLSITAITGYANSKVKLEHEQIIQNDFKINKNTKEINFVEETTNLVITVQSEDSTNTKNYILQLEKMSNNTGVSSVVVDGAEINIGEDGNYHYILPEAKNEVEVLVTAEDSNSKVQIANNLPENASSKKMLAITSKQTTEILRIITEDGTIKEYSLVIETLPDDTNIEQVVVNGKEAQYIDGSNRYEIRSDDINFGIGVTLSDSLASLVLGDNEKAIGQDHITITKTGEETIVKVTVTSQNGLEVQEYEIVILEKSNNTNIDTLIVNGKTVKQNVEGKYIANINGNSNAIDITVTAEDKYAIASIDGNTQNSYIMKMQNPIIEGQNTYIYQIGVQSENGTILNYELEVRILDGNNNILEISTSSDGVTYVPSQKLDKIEYYDRIDRVSEITIKVEPESSLSTVMINGKSGSIITVPVNDEENEVPIKVIAEDGTTKEVTLKLYKKTDEVGLFLENSDGTLKLLEEFESIYVDEDITSIDLSFRTKHEYSSLKLEGETDYTLFEITRTIDLSTYDPAEGLKVIVNLQAEDGTQKDYTITIWKQANLAISEVKINDNILVYQKQEERYYEIIANASQPTVSITAENEKQTIELLDKNDVVITSGIGSLNTILTLDEIEKNYTIKVISHNGEDYGMEESKLVIRQKSTETGISYIKVDNLGTIVNDTSYISTVSGKEKYPTEIKLKDSMAKAKITDIDGNVIIDYQAGTLAGELAVPDGQTKEFKVVVQSENGEQKEYNLSIQRISSNTQIESITVTDYEIDGETIQHKPVINYNEETKTYQVVVDKNLTSTQVQIKAVSEFTTIELDSMQSANGMLTFEKQLTGLGKHRTTINLTAVDGSSDTKYLEIIQLSDEIGIKELQVDGNIITQNEIGNYEVTVSDELPTNMVKVIAKSSTAQISINGEVDVLAQAEQLITKLPVRKMDIPIQITAEDGSSYTYTLTLNIISHDNTAGLVIVDGSNAKEEIGNQGKVEYIAYIDKYAQSATICVKANSSYATVAYKNGDIDLSNKETLEFTVDTSNMDLNIIDTPFTIIAEDGTSEEYILHLARKSEDNSIKSVIVNGKTVEANIDNPDYPIGSYYTQIVENVSTTNKAVVKVETNSEFAQIEFGNQTGVKMLEQTITLGNEKIMQIPIKITSQQGTIDETILYIEKVSDNFALDFITVNEENVTQGEDQYDFISYIYDVVQTSKVNIKAINENATIVRTNELGETYLDESGVATKEKGNLLMELPTATNKTIIYFKIIAENGVASEVYTLSIEKMNTDTTLKEIVVNDVVITPNADGKYVADVLDIDGNPSVKITANHKLAYVRIGLGEEYKQTMQEVVDLSTNKQTIIPITVRAQAGVSEVTYLYINKISTSINLDTVLLDGKEADRYTPETHTYTFSVNSDKIDCDLLVLTDNDYSNLWYENVNYGASFRTMINISEDEVAKVIKLKVVSEAGTQQEYTIEMIKKSTDTSLEYLKVNGKELSATGDSQEIYHTIIGHLDTETLIEVKTKSSYANIRLGDNNPIRGHESGVLDCSDLTQERIVIPVVVTAADGETVKTYHITLQRGSNNTQISELKVDDNAIQLSQKEENLYEAVIPSGQQMAKVEIILADIKGKIQLDEAEGTRTLTTNVVIPENEDSITKIITVTAEDGTIKEYTLRITKNSSIIGKVLTQNVQNKHISEIKVYRTEELKDVVDIETVIPYKEIQTEPDGSFVLGIEAGEYDIVITKLGYLSYRITNILVEGNEASEIGEINLLAGDLNQDGHIEINDLSAIVDYYGEIGAMTDNMTEVDRQKYMLKLSCDFNEDGFIDKLDRAILKKNYDKQAIIKEWINPDMPSVMSLKMNTTNNSIQKPNENGMILPMDCSYEITSEYGYRTHPITGERTKHTGIDISGEHHTSIFAVANGEVTYAGVQNGYGNCIEIKHEINGEIIYSFYAHLSRIDVEKGDIVAVGQKIGNEGGDPNIDENAGSSTGHHLHFEIRTKSGHGSDINPEKYISF